MFKKNGMRTVEKEQTCRFVEYIKKNSFLVYICVFILYFILGSIANWSLLVGENHMKWDIWCAEYPNQVLMSDALNNGTIPLWNPLIQYGTPYYAMLGCPVWYPITFVLALFGYTPTILALSYVIHIAIGGFGMFLLSIQQLDNGNKVWKTSTLLAGFSCGLFYCFSGTFLSNAEHIMIFVSAAWVPYIFFFTRKFIEHKRIMHAMCTGAAAGMILLGGYPEMFYDAFLFLFIYVIYFNYDKNIKFITNILYSIGKFIIVCVFTVCSSAISLIPFVNVMNLLSRTNGVGPVPGTYSMTTLFSLIFPGTSTFAHTGEISMANYYFGIFVILLIPAIIKSTQKNKAFYCSMATVAYFICIAGNSFLHGLLYRFLPMYANFRFPSLNRSLFVMFILLMAVKIIEEILDGSIISITLKFNKWLCVCTLFLAVIFGLMGNMSNEMAFFSSDYMLNFSKSAFLATIILVLYYVFLYCSNTKQVIGNQCGYLLIGIILLEVLTFHHVEMPLTIGFYQQLDYSYNSDVQNAVDIEFEKNAERNITTDFSNSMRTVDGLNSQNIVFYKTLSEDGYLSILLNDVQEYKNTYLRSIMEQNPVAYFTNNVVSSDDVVFEDWVNNGAVSPEQIYVDGEVPMVEKIVKFSPQIINSTPLEMKIDDRVITLSGTFTAENLKTGRFRLYFESNSVDTQLLRIIFEDNIGNYSEHSGSYIMQHSNGEHYIDIFLPNINGVYTNVMILADDILPTRIQMVETERMLRDEYVDIDKFGFNDMLLNVNAPSEGYITVLQAKYSGWKAYVDGVETDITLVDNCFMGVKVPEGEHTIELKFTPIDFYIGLTITGIFYITFLSVIICEVVNKKNSKSSLSSK